MKRHCLTAAGPSSRRSVEAAEADRVSSAPSAAKRMAMAVAALAARISQLKLKVRSRGASYNAAGRLSSAAVVSSRAWSTPSLSRRVLTQSSVLNPRQNNSACRRGPLATAGKRRDRVKCHIEPVGVEKQLDLAHSLSGVSRSSSRRRTQRWRCGVASCSTWLLLALLFPDDPKSCKSCRESLAYL